MPSRVSRLQYKNLPKFSRFSAMMMFADTSNGRLCLSEVILQLRSYTAQSLLSGLCSS